MTTAHIVAISAAFALIAGWFGGIAFMMFGKNGWLEISTGLKAERADNEKLREVISIEGAKKGERVSGPVDTALPFSTGRLRYSCPACGIKGNGLPPTICCDMDGTPWNITHEEISSSSWNCEVQGHRFVTTNIDGAVARVCMYCPANGGSAA